MTPLHKSAENGHFRIVEFLYYHGADINIKDIQGKTPLHYASSLGHVDIVEFLIVNGSKIDPIDEYILC